MNEPPEQVEADTPQAAEPKDPGVRPEVLGEATTLRAYLELVSQLNASGGIQLWFRGARKESYRLEPSLFRHPAVDNINDLIGLEWELLSEFRHRGPPFVGRLPAEDIELLFMMQHYGVPTRLLDWTENPLVALFFALENAREDAARDHDAAVWVLDPVGMNLKATEKREFPSKYVLGAYSDELNGYLPRREPTQITMKPPLALYGIHNSSRIVAQRGGFVLFGKDKTPLENNPDISGDGGVVRKVLIDKDSKESMFSELFRMGVSDSVIYPDLDGLGREIRNRRGF